MALALKSRGDEVTIATHAHYRENVERMGIRFLPIKPSQEDLGPEENWVKQANNIQTGLEFIIKNLMLPYLEESFAALESEVKQSDLVISHVLCFAAPLAAEKHGVPWISSVLQPGSFLSAYDLPRFGQALYLEKLKFLGPNFFKLLIPVVSIATNRWFEPLHAFRKKIGLQPSKKNPMVEGFSPFGNLVLFPKEFAAPQIDWPQKSMQVPFPIFDKEDRSDISTPLKKFLEEGTPPVVFTLGTAIIRTKNSFFADAYAAVERLRCRAVFLVGKEALGVPPAAFKNPKILISSYEPFSLLFSRCAAIVHQCGIGTTAQAIRSGRPQVLVPFAHDQPDNARRVVAKGLGQEIPLGGLSEKSLHSSLLSVLKDKNLAKNAAEFGKLIRKQNFEAEFLRAIDELTSLEN
jgi:UDP:flavonoid glycosyltransferase YjiC (YdhE family)